MRDFQLQSNFDCFLDTAQYTVHNHSFACLQIVQAFLTDSRLKLLPVLTQCNMTRTQSKRSPQFKIPHIQALLIPQPPNFGAIFHWSK